MVRLSPSFPSIVAFGLPRTIARDCSVWGRLSVTVGLLARASRRLVTPVLGPFERVDACLVRPPS